jgi:erythromycin esterase-like protein
MHASPRTRAESTARKPTYRRFARNQEEDMPENPDLIGTLDRDTQPVRWEPGDYDSLLESIGDSRVVLLGEATHGTHEFYRERSRITRRLIEEKGFTTVAVEADWPDAYRVNRFIRGMSEDSVAEEALSDFQRFPLWMWRNTDVVDLVDWLRAYNEQRAPKAHRVGFYGLDLYSLYTSIDAVLAYLREVDPDAAEQARYRYGCFGQFGEDSQAYGYAASIDVSRSCENEAIRQLLDLQSRAAELAGRDGRIPDDEYFYAEQNARLVRNAEQYYRTMFHGRISSWNLRDSHMAETLNALVEHFDRTGLQTRVVVWEHNSHIGDARATEMGNRGEWNVGQLAREKYGRSAYLVGFSTYTGTVAAADNWDEPAQVKRVQPALTGSYEALFHQAEAPNFLVPLRGGGPLADTLMDPRLQRAIGVIYRPQTERVSHYFHAQLPQQFDALLHFDETAAVAPLDRTPGWKTGDAPETYPFNV